MKIGKRVLSVFIIAIALAVVSTPIACGKAAEDTTSSNSNNLEKGSKGGPDAPPGGGSSGVTSYTAVKSITSDTTLENQTISSTGTDENAIYISNGAKATMNNLVVNRTSSDSTGGDNASFYGVGAAILNTKGTSIVNNTTINSDAKGGAGVFSYSDGITYVLNSTISTKKDTSGGIHAAGGGTLYAFDVNATTEAVER